MTISSPSSAWALPQGVEDKSILKIAQNMKYDWLVFAQRGIEIEGYDDTMLISYALDAGKGGHGMDELVGAMARLQNRSTSRTSPGRASRRRQLSIACRSTSATEYAAEDADVTLRLWTSEAAPRRRAATRLRNGRATAHARCWRGWSGAASRSTARCSRPLRRFAQNIGGWKRKSRARRRAVQPSARPSSSATSCSARWGCRRHARPRPGISTDAAIWKSSPSRARDAAQGARLAPALKLRSTYTDALQAEINPTTRRVHTSYSLAAHDRAAVVDDPNLQNIPIRTEEGRQIRARSSPSPAHAALGRLLADRVAARRRIWPTCRRCGGLPRRR